MNLDWPRYRRNPVDFLNEQYYIAKGQPIQLEAWQTDEILKPLLLTKNVDGVAVKHNDRCPCGSGADFVDCCIADYPRWYTEALVGMPKKSGKSELQAMVGFVDFFLATEPETYFCSNSKEQAASLSFDRFRRAVGLNKILSDGLEIHNTHIRNPIGNGLATILPHNSTTVAGKNPTFVGFDELWGFTAKESIRVFDEMTLSPARPEPLNMTVSYAGFQRSGPLWQLYQRGVNRTDAHLFYYWLTEYKASWVKPEYIEQQRKRLPESVFRRLHRNEWASGGGFITREKIEKAVDPALQYGHVRGGSCGLDLGLKRDRTCLTRVLTGNDGIMRLAYLRTWQGNSDAEVSIDDVEKAIIEQFKGNGARRVLVDPWQMKGSIQRLKGKVNVQEFNFTAQSVCRLANTLYEAFQNERIRIPNDPALIEELQNLQLVETANGWKFDHTSGGHDDRAVSIALAIMAELSAPVSRSHDDILADLKELQNSSERTGRGGGDNHSPWGDTRQRSEMREW